jgi:hypothetical protein
MTERRKPKPIVEGKEGACAGTFRWAPRGALIPLTPAEINAPWPPPGASRCPEGMVIMTIPFAQKRFQRILAPAKPARIGPKRHVPRRISAPGAVFSLSNQRPAGHYNCPETDN